MKNLYLAVALWVLGTVFAVAAWSLNTTTARVVYGYSMCQTVNEPSYFLWLGFHVAFLASILGCGHYLFRFFWRGLAKGQIW